MNTGIEISIIYNISLLLALSVVYAVIPKRALVFKGIKGIAVGIILGIVGTALMTNPFVLEPGIIFDTRSVLICVAGMFFGIAPTSAMVLITAGYRIYLGGGGVLAGVSVIVMSAVIGLLWHHFRFDSIINRKKNRFLELYMVGIIVHAVMIGCMLLMPPERVFYVIGEITVPVMVVYPLGTAVLGMLILRQMDQANLLIQLHESDERYRGLFENNRAIMLLIHPKYRNIVDANPAACRFYGWSLSELKKKVIEDLNESTQDEVKAQSSLVREGKITHLNIQHRRASGEVRDVEVYTCPVTAQGEELNFLIIHDVTKRREVQRWLEESEQRLKVTLLSVGDGVIATDRDGNITLINRTAQEIIECTDSIVGRPISEALRLYNEYTNEEIEDPVHKVIETGQVIGLANHTVLLSFGGRKKPIADSAAPIKDESGNLLGVVFVFRDVTEERQKQQQIEYLGYHDSLTGLYNRSFFDEELKRLDSKRNLPLSVIIGDVNGLKLTNDAFGHTVGDMLLKSMGAAIKKACRREDIIARWGGDEFIILLPKTDEKTAEIICDRISKNCANVKMADVDFSISLGYDTKQNEDGKMSEIIKSAEDYMYRKKSIESSSIRGKTIHTILLAFHERNPREQQHSKRVSEICYEIAEALGMSQREINELSLVGLMHDIGKIAINDQVLNKNGPLTQSEWEEIKKHPEIGYRILSASNEMAYLAEYVLKHHERPDGKGYPNRIKGDEIPLESRIIAIADAYDAMTSKRPYRDSLTEDNAIQQLREHSGTQFDSDIVDIFIKEVLGR